MLLKRALCSSTVGVKLHTGSDGRLFNPARMKSKSTVKQITVRNLLFVDDAPLVVHSAKDMQTILN